MSSQCESSINWGWDRRRVSLLEGHLSTLAPKGTQRFVISVGGYIVLLRRHVVPRAGTTCVLTLWAETQDSVSPSGSQVFSRLPDQGPHSK